MNDHLRYHGYDGVPGIVAKAGFNASNLVTVVHRGMAMKCCYLSTALHVTTPQGFQFTNDIKTDLPFFSSKV